MRFGRIAQYDLVFAIVVTDGDGVFRRIHLACRIAERSIEIGEADPVAFREARGSCQRRFPSGIRKDSFHQKPDTSRSTTCVGLQGKHGPKPSSIGVGLAPVFMKIGMVVSLPHLGFRSDAAGIVLRLPPPCQPRPEHPRNRRGRAGRSTGQSRCPASRAAERRGRAPRPGTRTGCAAAARASARRSGQIAGRTKNRPGPAHSRMERASGDRASIAAADSAREDGRIGRGGIVAGLRAGRCSARALPHAPWPGRQSAELPG